MFFLLKINEFWYDGIFLKTWRSPNSKHFHDASLSSEGKMYSSTEFLELLRSPLKYTPLYGAVWQGYCNISRNSVDLHPHQNFDVDEDQPNSLKYLPLMLWTRYSVRPTGAFHDTSDLTANIRIYKFRIRPILSNTPSLSNTPLVLQPS